MRIFFFLYLLFFSSHVLIAQATNEVILYNQSGEIIESQPLLNNEKAKVFIFWSSYCRYCKLEMKGIRNIGQNWWEDYDAEVVFVSLENFSSNAYKKLDFLQEITQQDGFHLLYDNQMAFYRALEGESIPFTILFDKNGEEIQRWAAYDDGLERSIGMYFKKLKAREYE